MEHPLIFLSAVSLLLTSTLVSTTPTGETDDTNAQAIPIGSGGEAGSGLTEDNFVLMRRGYLPRFVGKREPPQVALGVKDSEYDTQPQSLDKDNTLNDYVEDLLDYYQYIDNNDNDNEETDDMYLDNNGSEEENGTDDDDNSMNTQEAEKRYIPSFVGKRQFRPMFVGKRYRPMFVGKRYQPRFVGKRYQPMFVGKRYTPKFIGKRYRPMFVGKRYIPQFVGKRYQPKFIGKRYQPKFIGKRYQPKFIGKRYQPFFVGKKASPRPMFIGKRYQPKFIGKRSDIDTLENNAENGHIEKRSASNTELTEQQTETDHSEPNKRRKRSVIFGMSPVTKRFVAPEFIGRRDSLSSILSALDALQFARDSARSTSKRFEAPLFIGKRMRPLFVGKRTVDSVGDIETDRDFEFSPRQSEYNLGAYERIPEDLFQYGEIFPSLDGKL